MNSKTKPIQKSVKSFDNSKIVYDIKHVPHSHETLVLLHGLGGDLSAWDLERSLLTKLGCSTLAIDLRGHGLSDRPTEHKSYKMTAFAKDVQKVLEKENVNNAIVVGHCFGGMIALIIAATFPKLCKALILIDTSYKAPVLAANPISKALLLSMVSVFKQQQNTHNHKGHVDFSKFVGGGDFDLHRLLSDISHTSLYSYLAATKQMLEYDATELLGKIVIPTLIITGTNDHIIPPEIAKQLSTRITNSQLTYIEDGNHIVIINNPNELVEEIHTFLQRVST